ncbi:MAG: hypothetical protein AAGA69_04780, partial [Pseudomonadota bacterium]
MTKLIVTNGVNELFTSSTLQNDLAEGHTKGLEPSSFSNDEEQYVSPFLTSAASQITKPDAGLNDQPAAHNGSGTTFTVTTLNDGGDDNFNSGDLAAETADGGGLSLREALALAQDGDTITFDNSSDAVFESGGTITLAGTELTISQLDLTIDGDLDDDGTADVTIDGNDMSRVMVITGGS